MASSSSTRDARRRKIAERGSDRLALITGRIQTLPSSESSDLQFQSNPQLDNPIVFPHVEDEASGSTLLPKVNHSDDSVPAGTNLEPSEPTFETNAAEPTTRSLGVEATESRPSVSASATERRPVESQTQALSFTPKQISSAISSTEKTRLYFSVAFSVSVVLSCLGFPILGSAAFKSVLSLRPLYLVLLTNVTLVVLELLEKHRIPGRTGRGDSGNHPSDGNDFAEQIGKTLEIGLLIQKAADAVLMNCSVYAVIVICGLSFAPKSG